MAKAQKSFYGFFHALLSSPDGRAVLWHCVNGRDRTGIGAVLLLAAAAAPACWPCQTCFPTKRHFRRFRKELVHD
ncbi:tyrosine-protein phosphatase [Aminicella lysinilytica]|uniref:tyrosine-protein phosphatase n=1 Tax=Aminicella lysinilytica TaxID=433323 RepID=UPI0038BA37DF